MAFLGKQVRLRRLFNRKSGHLLAIALDHAIAWGVIEGTENIQATVDTVAASEPDAITIQKGIAEKCMGKWAGHQAFILKCSSFSPFYPSYDGYTGTIEEAVAKLSGKTEEVFPNPRHSEIYSRRFQLYKALYHALLPIFDKAAGNRVE